MTYLRVLNILLNVWFLYIFPIYKFRFHNITWIAKRRQAATGIMERKNGKSRITFTAHMTLPNTSSEHGPFHRTKPSAIRRPLSLSKLATTRFDRDSYSYLKDKTFKLLLPGCREILLKWKRYVCTTIIKWQEAYGNIVHLWKCG